VGLPPDCSRVKYVSNYGFPLAELNRTLTPIAGYDAGVCKFTTIDISDKISINGKFKYVGGVLGLDGKTVFPPYGADNIGIFDPSNRSFITIDISDKISINGKYAGGLLRPDSKIVFARPCAT